MKRILCENEQVRISTREINELYGGLFIYATNGETDETDGTTYCIPRIVCSSRQELTADDTLQYRMDEEKYGNLAYLDYSPQPDRLMLWTDQI